MTRTIFTVVLAGTLAAVLAQPARGLLVTLNGQKVFEDSFDAHAVVAPLTSTGSATRELVELNAPLPLGGKWKLTSGVGPTPSKMSISDIMAKGLSGNFLRVVSNDREYPHFKAAFDQAVGQAGDEVSVKFSMRFTDMQRRFGIRVNLRDDPNGGNYGPGMLNFCSSGTPCTAGDPQRFRGMSGTINGNGSGEVPGIDGGDGNWHMIEWNYILGSNTYDLIVDGVVKAVNFSGSGSSSSAGSINQIGQLEFYRNTNAAFADIQGDYDVDQFPEPASLALLSLGGLMMLRRKW